MKTRLILALILVTLPLLNAADAPIPNRLIDYPGFLRDAEIVGKLRQERRISEAEFIRMATEPGTVVLDARSREKYELLHIQGALHLSLPDFTAEALAKLIPDNTTRILIYCNNNFENENEAFQTKTRSASLNIYTFNTLYSYGYRNVYELGPLLDIHRSQFTFAGTRATQLKSSK